MGSDGDWQPPPGTVKRNCLECQKPFASRDGATICPICLKGAPAVARRKREAASVSSYAPDVGGRSTSLGPSVVKRL